MTVLFVDKFLTAKKCTLEELGGILPKQGDKIVWEYEPYPTVKEILWDIDKKEIFISIDR